MKPAEGDGIVDVKLCREDDDVLLTRGGGKTIRFKVTDIRRFVGRTSSGVRGIKLPEGDEVISMAVLRHMDVTPDEARAYMKYANAKRRALGDDVEDTDVGTDDNTLSMERIIELEANEQFVLTIADDGYGKRSSSYDYRCMNRGGQGVSAQDITRKGDPDARLVRAFSITEDDQLMLVTDGGQLIRCPVRNISVISRSSKGVMVLRVSDGEKVVSVERIEESDDEDAPDAETDAGGETAPE